MTRPTLEHAEGVLRERWGYPSFRKFQQEAIPHVLRGENLLAIVQTGGGKSMLFQIPAVLLPGTCLVFSPLIALMQDQVTECDKRGIPATFINSRLEPEEVEQRVNDMIAGAYKLVYIAPERLSVRSFRDAIANTEISFIAIDEAHSVSRYGHAFRPDYMRLHVAGDIVQQATGKRPPCLMLTATCTSGIEDDIIKSLGVDRDGCEIIVGDPIRPNLIYDTIIPMSSPWGLVQTIANQRFGIPGRHLIYAATRAATDKLCEILSAQWPKMGAYHAGKERERDNIQDAFKAGDLLRMSCTNAFGMGIDIPDIRTVIHFGVPGSVEDYVQEVGRGGRDGNESHGILLHDERAVEMQQLFIDGANPPPQFYPLVWDFLLKVVPPGTELTMTSERIAKAISDTIPTTRGTGPSPQVPVRAVATILNIMERHGLVERRFMKQAGSPVLVDERKLRDILARHADNDALQTFGNRLIREAQGGMATMDGKAWAAEMGIKTFTFNKVKKIVKDGGGAEFKRAFTGKSTKVPMRNAGTDLADRLPLEGLEVKRQHDLGKLRSMLEYADLRTLSERRDFIRRYFMDPPAEGSNLNSVADSKLADTVELLKELALSRDLD